MFGRWFPSVTLFLLAGGVLRADGDDTWPQFRGPYGAGLSASGAKGPVNFAPGKNELWKVALPEGYSSPCVWRDRIFLTSCDSKQKKLETLCLNRADGRVLWRDAVAVEALENVHKTNSPASATPACDGRRLYVYFGSFGLIAYNLDGVKAWELRLPMPQVMFGSGTSPIVAGEVVLLNRLQQGAMPRFGTKAPEASEPAKSEVLAIERDSGKVRWRTALSMGMMGRSHVTPVACKTGDKSLVIVAGGGRLTALNVADGSIAWWADNLPSVATASPIVAGERIFVNCTGVAGDVDIVPLPSFDDALKTWDKNGDGKLQRDEIPNELALFTRHRADHEGDFALKQFFFNRVDKDRDGALARDEWEQAIRAVTDEWTQRFKPALVALKLGGEKDVTKSHALWQTDRGVPEVPTMLVVGHRLYAVRNGGLVTCYHADSGHVLFEQRLGASGSYYASPISDGTNVYFISQPGVVTILRGADQYERVARIDLGEEVSATPALVDGKLYLRTHKHLYAFDGER